MIYVEPIYQATKEDPLRLFGYLCGGNMISELFARACDKHTEDYDEFIKVDGCNISRLIFDAETEKFIELAFDFDKEFSRLVGREKLHALDFIASNMLERNTREAAKVYLELLIDRLDSLASSLQNQFGTRYRILSDSIDSLKGELREHYRRFLPETPDPEVLKNKVFTWVGDEVVWSRLYFALKSRDWIECDEASFREAFNGDLVSEQLRIKWKAKGERSKSINLATLVTIISGLRKSGFIADDFTNDDTKLRKRLLSIFVNSAGMPLNDGSLKQRISDEKTHPPTKVQIEIWKSINRILHGH